MLEHKTMSLIKKNDVIKAIGEEVLNVTLNMPWSVASKEMARNTLYALKQTVQVMPEIEKSSWISVKERMPEAEQKVLVYAVGYAFGFEGDTVMAITCQSMHRDGSMYWHSPWQYFQSDYKITHWMPLPPCPEQEDDDDA